MTRTKKAEAVETDQDYPTDTPTKKRGVDRWGVGFSVNDPNVSPWSMGQGVDYPDVERAYRAFMRRDYRPPLWVTV